MVRSAIRQQQKRTEMHPQWVPPARETFTFLNCRLQRERVKTYKYLQGIDLPDQHGPHLFMRATRSHHSHACTRIEWKDRHDGQGMHSSCACKQPRLT